MSHFNPRCPFHTAVATGLAILTISSIYNHLSKKESKIIQKFDVSTRFVGTIKYGDLVFITGQVGEGSTIEEQTQSALAKVDAALQKAGTNKSKILECTIWLSDIAKDYIGMNSVYDGWLVAGSPSTRACVEAKLAAPIYKVEVRVIAAAY